MLILTRQKNESIAIVIPLGKSTFLIFEVRVVDIRGDKIRLAVHAPREVAIDRWEIWEGKREDLFKSLREQRLLPTEIRRGDLPKAVAEHLASFGRATTSG